jgi:hypothetical protein
MTMRLSTGLRNKLLDGGAAGGVKGSFNLGFIAIMTGSQPTTADAAATGTLLGTISVNGGGTGITFDAAVAGVLSKAAAETWRFTGLVAGVAGWFRLYAPGDTITNLSTTAARLDGSIGTSGADLNLTNLNITVAQVNTCDTFTVTMPAA